MTDGLVSAGPAHAAALAAIHAASFPAAARWNASAFAAVLAQPGAFALIDPAGGCVLARLAADEAEVLTLAVVANRRRQGRARALLRAAMRQAAGSGAAALFLEVAADNPGALALYAAEGFREVGRRPGYYPDGADALVLRCGLDAASPAGHGCPR